MEQTTKEQAVINVLATNMSQKIAVLEGDKAILLVEIQMVKEEFESLKQEFEALKNKIKEGDA